MAKFESFYLPEYRSQAQSGTGLSRVRLPKAGEVLSVKAYCELVGSGTVATEFDLKINGSSIFQTAGNRPKIQPGAYSSNLATPNSPARIFTGHELLTVDCTMVSEVPPTHLSFEVNLRLDDVLLEIAATEVQKLLHTHYQTTPSATWNITHNLNRRPTVIVTDSAGTEHKVEIDYPDLNTAVVTMAYSFSGRADLV